MRRHRTPARLAVVLASISCLTFAATASAASTTLTFKEPEKGATFAFVDNVPKSHSAHGFIRFSAGDEIIFTNTLEADGKVVGKIRAVCTATEGENPRNPSLSGFLCTILAKIPGGTLVLASPLSDGSAGTEGAVTGGTGKYVGARGTFVVKESRGFDTNTITLLE
jgi:hypothetical protein